MEKEYLKKIETMIKETAARSAWKKGVKLYALEMLETLADYENLPDNIVELKEQLLNGAKDWNQYSHGGCALVFDGDIAERLCTPSELKRTRNGELKPNSREEWLDTQARALYQAFILIRDKFETIWTKEQRIRGVFYGN